MIDQLLWKNVLNFTSDILLERPHSFWCKRSDLTRGVSIYLYEICH